MLTSLSLLVKEGRISAVPVHLGPRDKFVRSIFWTNELASWCNELASSQEKPSGILSFGEQINLAFADFIAGRPLASGVTRCDPPTGEGIWKLHTPDIRFFGWCDQPQTLVIVNAELKRRLVSEYGLTTKKMAMRAVAIRRSLGIKAWQSGDIRTAFPTAR